jgi:hypothetical protein
METSQEAKQRAAAEALRKVMSDPNKEGKDKLVQVLKALTAMRLKNEDGVPSPVLTLTDGELGFVEQGETKAFLYQGSVGAAYN